MKILSIPQPDASNLVRGGQAIYFLAFETDFRGPLLVSASEIPQPDPDEDPVLPRGMVLATAKLIDCRPFDPDELQAGRQTQLPKESGFAWVFEDIREIELFSVAGGPGLFEAQIGPEEVIALDLSAYEDHVEYFHKAILPGQESSMEDIHEERLWRGTKKRS